MTASPLPTPEAGPTWRAPTEDVSSRVLTRGFLLAAALLILLGGLLHAHVAGDPATQLRLIAEDPRWTPVHLALTLGQLLAIPPALLLAMRWRSGHDATLVAGLALVAMGLFIGALATFASATVLHAAAAAGNAELFSIIEPATLALGWLCVLTSGPGAGLVGAHLLAAPGLDARGTGALLLIGGLALTLAAVGMPPGHPWLHPYLLRYGAVLLAALLAVLAASLPRASRAPGPARAGSPLP